MEANQLIEVFTNVVKEQDYLFANVSRSEIELLQHQLKEARDHSPEPSEQIFEILCQWCKKYPDILDAVFESESRGKIKPKTTKPESQEEIQENQTRILEEELEKLKNKPRQSQGETIYNQTQILGYESENFKNMF